MDVLSSVLELVGFATRETVNRHVDSFLALDFVEVTVSLPGFAKRTEVPNQVVPQYFGPARLLVHQD